MVGVVAELPVSNLHAVLLDLMDERGVLILKILRAEADWLDKPA